MLATELRDYLDKFINTCGDGHVINTEDENITFVASFGQSSDPDDEPSCVLAFGLPKNDDGSLYTGK